VGCKALFHIVSAEQAVAASQKEALEGDADGQKSCAVNINDSVDDDDDAVYTDLF
jgi:hypothetical protein